MIRKKGVYAILEEIVVQNSKVLKTSDQVTPTPAGKNSRIKQASEKVLVKVVLRNVKAPELAKEKAGVPKSAKTVRT